LQLENAIDPAPAPTTRGAQLAAIGPYQVVASIGRGGMGSVYAVRRRTGFGLEKLLAVKVLNPQLIDDRRFVDMFLDEARIAVHLQHPNIVTTLDVVEHDGLPLIVMELLRGQSLSQLLARRPDPPRQVLYAILARAARGLIAVHEARGADGNPLRVVHRDISPHNIHVGYDGQVKLIDFGIAAARGKISSTRTGEVKGKLAYLAPEQLMQGNIDQRTDLFAFGIVAWESLTGNRLFRQVDEATTLWAVVNKPIPDLASLADDVTASVSTLVSKLLERTASLRPASAREVAKAFTEAAGPDADEEAIGRLMCEAFSAERERDEARFRVDMSRLRVAELPQRLPSPSPLDAHLETPKPMDAASGRRLRPALGAVDSTLTDVAVNAVASAPTTVSVRFGRSTIGAALIVFALAVAGVWGLVRAVRGHEVLAAPTLTLAAAKPPAQGELSATEPSPGFSATAKPAPPASAPRLSAAPSGSASAPAPARGTPARRPNKRTPPAPTSAERSGKSQPGLLKSPY